MMPGLGGSENHETNDTVILDGNTQIVDITQLVDADGQQVTLTGEGTGRRRCEGTGTGEVCTTDVQVFAHVASS
jgi:hypothetical protein